MDILTTHKQLEQTARDMAYTAYRLEERASGTYVVLSTSSEEATFELSDKLTDQMKALLCLQLERTMRQHNPGNTSLTPDSGYIAVPNREN